MPIDAACLTPALLSLVRSLADEPEVHEHRDDHDHEIDPGNALVRVHRPCVGEGRERHEEKAEEGPVVRLVRAAEIVAEQENEEEREPRKQKAEAADQTAHRAEGISLREAVQERLT